MVIKTYESNLSIISQDEDDFLPDEDEKAHAAMDIAMVLGKSPVDLLHYSVSPGFKHT